MLSLYGVGKRRKVGRAWEGGKEREREREQTGGGVSVPRQGRGIEFEQASQAFRTCSTTQSITEEFISSEHA